MNLCAVVRVSLVLVTEVGKRASWAGKDWRRRGQCHQYENNTAEFHQFSWQMTYLLQRWRCWSGTWGEGGGGGATEASWHCSEHYPMKTRQRGARYKRVKWVPFDREVDSAKRKLGAGCHGDGLLPLIWLYRIAGNFHGRKLSQNAHWCRKKSHAPQILRRKLLRIAKKPQNSQQFSPSKVSHYTITNLIGYFTDIVMTRWYVPSWSWRGQAGRWFHSRWFHQPQTQGRMSACMPVGRGRGEGRHYHRS